MVVNPTVLRSPFVIVTIIVIVIVIVIGAFDDDYDHE
jgi:hypothetical protein